MATYGITITGFIRKPLSIILDEIDDALKSEFGPEINTADETVFGQLKGIFAEREKLLWELTEEVYNSHVANAAEGVPFDNILGLNGLERLAASYSTIQNQRLFGTATTVIPVGTQFSVLNDETVIFATDTEVTLIAGTDEVQTIGFSGTPTSGAFTVTFNGEETASIPYTAANTDVQTALNALSNLSGVTVSGTFAADFVVTFAGDDGKQIQPLLVESVNTLNDGGAITITISETTPGVNQGITDMTCTETGAVEVNADTLTVINNPISGLDSTRNPTAAAPGREIETDAEAKIRRTTRLTTSQAGPIEAIKTHILELNDDPDEPTLTTVRVFENVTDSVDAKGIPAHGIAAFVRQAGDVTTRDEEIAQAIFESTCAGIETSWGNATGGNQVTETITDSMEIDHTIKFGRPAAGVIYCNIYDLVTDTDEYPADGDDLIKQALVAWGETLGVGADVVVYPLLVSQLADIPGILDFKVNIGKGSLPGTPADDNISIDDGSVSAPEYSSWSLTNMTVTDL